MNSQSFLYIGADHGGYKLKEHLKGYLAQQGIHFLDLGCFNEDPIDYPDVAREVSEKVAEGKEQGAKGVLICGTGLGVCMAANKYPGIRAASTMTKEMAEMARRHNDANIACLGGRIMDFEMAKEIIDVFVHTEFDGDERHVRRIEKMA